MRESRLRRVIACALCAAIPSTALADGAGVIATTHPEGPSRAEVAAAMTKAMQGRAGRILDDAVGDARAAITAGAVPIEALATFKRVRTQIDAGWRSYLRVAVEPSRDALVLARTAAEPLVALAGGAELYADAALRLGMVLAQLGRRDEANAVLALALALDPDRPVTTAEFSPDLVEVVDAARGVPVALHTVHITTTPPGAAVRIDGKEVGRAPLDVQVTASQHLIVARASQHRPAVQGVAEGATSVEVQLEPDEEATRLDAGAVAGMPDVAAQQLVDATLRFADLDEVVLVSATVRRGGPSLVVQRCAGPAPSRCSAVVEIGYSDRAGLAAAAKSAWQAVIIGDLRYEPTVLGEQGRRTPGPRHWYQRPVVWTGVGAALLAGAVIAIVATSVTTPPPKVGIDGNQF